MFIAILSCHRYKERREQQRFTWLRDCEIDYKYLLGKGYSDYVPEADEIILDVPDDYESLPFKTHGAVKWAHEHGYTSIFKTDDETYVCPSRLGVPRGCYVGRVEYDERKAWCNGGPGYWLCGAAIDYVSASIPARGAEDKWVAECLREHGIQPYHDPRYSMPGRGRDYPRPENDIITFTGCCSIDGAPTMYEIHKLWQLEQSNK